MADDLIEESGKDVGNPKIDMDWYRSHNINIEFPGLDLKENERANYYFSQLVRFLAYPKYSSTDYLNVMYLYLVKRQFSAAIEFIHLLREFKKEKLDLICADVKAKVPDFESNYNISATLANWQEFCSFDKRSTKLEDSEFLRQFCLNLHSTKEGAERNIIKFILANWQQFCFFDKKNTKLEDSKFFHQFYPEQMKEDVERNFLKFILASERRFNSSDIQDTKLAEPLLQLYSDLHRLYPDQMDESAGLHIAKLVLASWQQFCSSDAKNAQLAELLRQFCLDLHQMEQGIELNMVRTRDSIVLPKSDAYGVKSAGSTSALFRFCMQINGELVLLPAKFLSIKSKELVPNKENNESSLIINESHIDSIQIQEVNSDRIDDEDDLIINENDIDSMQYAITLEGEGVHYIKEYIDGNQESLGKFVAAANKAVMVEKMLELLKEQLIVQMNYTLQPLHARFKKLGIEKRGEDPIKKAKRQVYHQLFASFNDVIAQQLEYAKNQFIPEIDRIWDGKAPFPAPESNVLINFTEATQKTVNKVHYKYVNSTTEVIAQVQMSDEQRKILGKHQHILKNLIPFAGAVYAAALRVFYVSIFNTREKSEKSTKKLFQEYFNQYTRTESLNALIKSRQRLDDNRGNTKNNLKENSYGRFYIAALSDGLKNNMDFSPSDDKPNPIIQKLSEQTQQLSRI
ncbi:MAG: hypothetical protein HKM04_01545 [Legionellales bacterium]|nr:hypothetical protein [Legionellales bacterium]